MGSVVMGGRGLESGTKYRPCRTALGGGHGPRAAHGSDRGIGEQMLVAAHGLP
jgi:hypothetical protein